MHSDNARLSKPRNNLFESRSRFENGEDLGELLERELDWAEVNRLLDPDYFDADGFGGLSNGRSIGGYEASVSFGNQFSFNANHYASTTESCGHQLLPGFPCVLCSYAQTCPSAARSGLTTVVQNALDFSAGSVQTWSGNALETQPSQNTPSSEGSHSPTLGHADSTASDKPPHTAINGKCPIARGSNVSTQRSGKDAAQRHQCATPLCTSSFGRPSDLRRHEADIHARAQKIYKCNSCGYAKRERKDKVMEHCKKRKHHGFSKIDMLEDDVSGIVVSPVRTRNR